MENPVTKLNTMREQRLQAFKIKWEELTHPDRTTKWKNGKETYKKCKDSDLDDTQETGTFLTSAYTRTNADYSKRLICLLKIKDLSLTLFECIYFRKFVISFSLWNACNFFFLSGISLLPGLTTQNVVLKDWNHPYEM